MTSNPDLSVLIVNWKSGAMTRALVRNLRAQRFSLRDGEPGTIEFVVTDNASGPAEEPHLAALEAEPDVTLVRSRQNGGYGAGMNLAAERAKGDYFLVSNPDVMAFRGAVAALLEHLRGAPRCGMAGPRGYLDAQRFFQLPPVELPSLGGLVHEAAGRRVRAAGRCLAETRSRRALEVWTATAPRAMSQLSGFCFLMPAPLARELGPFDARFPFYYEDADLCRRVRGRGFTTDFVPRAQMVHFFNRSAGQAQAAAMSRYAVSRRLFFRKRYGPLGGLAHDLLVGVAGHDGKGHEFAPIEALGEFEQPPAVEVPGGGSYLAEISADAGFLFAAGRLDVSRRFQIPQEVWEGLVPTTYFLRFLRRSSLKVLRTVSLVKLGESRATDADRASLELVHA